MGKWEKWGEIFFSKISQIQRNTPTKHWVFSEKTHTGKIRNFLNEKNWIWFLQKYAPPSLHIFGW